MIRQKRQSKPLNQELNITNLVDVVFAILVVFMITAPLMSQGIKVDLPNTEAPAIEDKELLKVSIDENEEIYIGKQKVGKNSFAREFKKHWDKKSAILINSDQNVAYGKVMQVVSKVQSLGVEKFGFLTNGKSEVSWEELPE